MSASTATTNISTSIPANIPVVSNNFEDLVGDMAVLLRNKYIKTVEEILRYLDAYDRKDEIISLFIPSEYVKKISGKKRKKVGPKKPVNAYIIFSNEHRAKVIAENPGIKTNKVMNEIGKKWSSLSKEDKEIYERKAADDKVRFQDELEVYKNQASGAVGLSNAPPSVDTAKVAKKTKSEVAVATEASA